MAPDAVQTVGSWLRSHWHVCVPEGWLQACVEWLQQEAGGRPLTLPQLQQLVLEQWLQTDLRSLGMSSLPAAVSEAEKTHLQGSLCVQLDSLLDVSQPAYTQLQRLRGSERDNDLIGAATQVTQRPWEAAPSRMLMLQLTDGVQSVEAMECRPVPQLNTRLPAGTKLLLRGPITCRLGVLLLGPQNVQVLGGEVEELLHTNTQAHVLCRALGLPEEEPAEEEAEGVPPERAEEAAPGAEEDLDDLELMASLEAVEESSLDSGYRSASMVSRAPSRPSPQQHFPLEDSAWGSPSYAPEEDFPDDDIPLEELDSVLSQHMSQEMGQGDVLPHPEPTSTISPQISVPRPLAYTRSPEREYSPHPATSERAQQRRHRGSDTVSEVEHAVVARDSPPFSYLLNLELGVPREIRVHAFVVTLKGNMRSAGGSWSLDVCLSDGSAYVDAELGDAVLAELIGFSAAEARALRRNPEGQAQVTAGIQRCQRALVDMCGIMTLRTEPQRARPLVLEVRSATQSDCLALQQRVELRRAQC
ncbi:recQ-mediated genome instability protein 1 [Alosa sapidissima]|uniref:recQ-mediated genome instability protein 1 n=1 Tax=Alosa sapidissima TaxID=34773 RepID=UPI001C08EEFA|nr:recQ-mediated genome instability protein 1 [Alosa sapidissima]XP_041957892.1 recQ-mediated genome instability protein 1 [Alosa sapidissima]XP_041957893.1 recQ-mediated genome instability protein 1 [Alosa sapidissima]XP_041957894.1 recQ-mediated genome instability protein 1 [Alosa sapidissima]XP_041957896.1 recQ-mediated genome instability protein 1 [Alosa sapidissima]XP_041957897.1 recQ-mediated genome instability protein 1 [Alosa sapidissima]